MLAPLALSSDSVARYREQGLLSLGRVMDDAGLAALRAEEERFRLRFAYVQLLGPNDDPHSWMVAGEA